MLQYHHDTNQYPPLDLAALRKSRKTVTRGTWLVVDDGGDSPRAMTSTATPGESLLGLDRDGMAVVERGADALAIVLLNNCADEILSLVDAQAAEIAKLKSERRDYERVTEPYPLHSIVAHLVDAADYLFDRENCDQHGWETATAARNHAKAWLAKFYPHADHVPVFNNPSGEPGR